MNELQKVLLAAAILGADDIAAAEKKRQRKADKLRALELRKRADRIETAAGEKL